MEKLIYNNIAILNRKIVTVLTLNDPLKNIFIVKCNKTRHLINCFQIERFAWSIGHNIIIFSAQYSCTKREKEENILHKDLFSIQDGDNRANGPGLLYYYKGMPIALLTNMYTVLGMVNRA